jgi:hypothetical protein
MGQRQSKEETNGDKKRRQGNNQLLTKIEDIEYV